MPLALLATSTFDLYCGSWKGSNCKQVCDLLTMDVVPVPQRLQFDSERLRCHLEKKLVGFSCEPGQLQVQKFK